MAPGLRHLYAPGSVQVELGPIGLPEAVDGTPVQAVREEWRVEDRWWTPKPLRRSYFDLALVDGRAAVVFRCDVSGRWYRQRA